jgi:putative transposase
MEYQHSAHATYRLEYHLVWITKYRKPVLHGEVAKRARALIRQTCATLDVEILSGHMAVDHVHLLVSIPPQWSISQVMQRLKGRSSRKLLQEFGELRRQYWGQHLWARGYFAASVGAVLEEVVKRYIESHDVQSPDADDNFQVGEL